MRERPRGARVAPGAPPPLGRLARACHHASQFTSLPVARVGGVSSVQGVRTLVIGEGVIAVVPGQGVVTGQGMQDIGPMPSSLRRRPKGSKRCEPRLTPR